MGQLETGEETFIVDSDTKADWNKTAETRAKAREVFSIALSRLRKMRNEAKESATGPAVATERLAAMLRESAAGGEVDWERAFDAAMGMLSDWTDEPPGLADGGEPCEEEKDQEAE